MCQHNNVLQAFGGAAERMCKTEVLVGEGTMCGTSHRAILVSC